MDTELLERTCMGTRERYQRDKVAGTYYAQAREYHPGLARFVERDIVKGCTR